MKSRFSLVQKIRNKIRIKGDLKVSLSKDVKLSACDIRINGNNNSLIIKKGATLRYVHIEILGDNCTLYIGENSIIGQGCYLSVKNGTKLEIGDSCMLSRNAKLMTSDGHNILQDGHVLNEAKSIFLENHVWLADNVTILKGVTIGKNSVVGINATVTKDIPSSCVAVGNPAVIVKENINWET